ncbi:hypothetical protein HY500_01955 [Candidatus Woesearchaeota archaeon]|nr:hypothetical protein [Candidatus Woesearchaeota archaeon]
MQKAKRNNYLFFLILTDLQSLIILLNITIARVNVIIKRGETIDSYPFKSITFRRTSILKTLDIIKSRKLKRITYNTLPSLPLDKLAELKV